MKKEEITNNDRKIYLVFGLIIFNFYFLSLFGFVAEYLPLLFRVSGFIFGVFLLWESQ